MEGTTIGSVDWTRHILLPLFGAAVLQLAAWGIGRPLVTLLAPHRRSQPGLGEHGHFLAALVGFGALSHLALLLGWIGALDRRLLLGLSLAAGGWGAGLAIRDLRRRRRYVLRLGDWPAILAWAFLGTFLFSGLLPVLHHDDASYHLLLPRLYLEAGRIRGLPFLFFANMPHLTDVLWTWGLSFGDFVTVKLLPIGFTGWTLAALWSHTARRAGRFAAGLLLVAFLAGKSLQWHLGLAYVEPVLGAYLLGATLAIVAWWRGGSGGELRLVGLLCGLAAASKYTAWFFVAVLGVAVLGRLVKRRPAGWIGRAGELAAWSLLPVLPWLLKNMLVVGNPIYPNAWTLFGGPGWSAAQSDQLWQVTRLPGRELASGLLGALTMPFNLTIRDHVFDAPSASLALVVLALLAPVGWRRARGEGRLLALLPWPGLFLWWLLMSHGRYLVAWLPVVALGAAVPLRVLARTRWRRAGLAAAVVVAAAWQLASQRERWRPPLEVLRRPRQELVATNASWPLNRALESLVPPGGVVLGMWENRFFFLPREVQVDGSYQAPSGLARLRSAGDPGRFAEELAGQGVTHVVIHARQMQLYLNNGDSRHVGFPELDRAERAADRALMLRFVGEELLLRQELGPWGLFELRRAASASPPLTGSGAPRR